MGASELLRGLSLMGASELLRKIEMVAVFPGQQRHKTHSQPCVLVYLQFWIFRDL